MVAYLNPNFTEWYEDAGSKQASFGGGDAGGGGDERAPAACVAWPREGALADLVLYDARSVSELLARPQTDRAVLRRGELIDARLPAFEELDGDVAVPTKVEFDLDVRRGAVVVDSAAAE